MPSFETIGLLVLENFFKVFTIYGHVGHISCVTETILVDLCPLFQTRLHIESGFELLSGFRGDV